MSASWACRTHFLRWAMLLLCIAVIAVSASLDASAIASAAVQSALKLQQRQADARPQAMAYLRDVFGGQPEQLERLKMGQRYQGTLPVAGSNRNASRCEACEALNKLYEADWPRFESRMEELVVGRGYPLERHAVVSPDGYELVLFRIPHGQQGPSGPGKRPPVLLHHGISLASDTFVLYGANESLAFILADAGFDVWLANQRGNTYSRRNVNGLYAYQPEFWYWTLDDVAQLDLPTEIDYVLQTTGASKLGYVGHSQGCLLANLMLSAKPEYNAKIAVLAEMAPVFFVQYFNAFFSRVSALTYADQLFYPLRIGEFLPNRLTAPLFGPLCTGFPLDAVCAAAVGFFWFGPSRRVKAADYQDILKTWPSSVSSRNMVQLSQNLRRSDGEFRPYDFGNTCNATSWSPLRGIRPKPFRESCNLQQYGVSGTPPAYDLSRVTAPTVYFLGDDDVVSTPADIAEQQRRIGAANKRQFNYPRWAHMDFVWSRQPIYAEDMVKTLKQYAAGTY